MCCCRVGDLANKQRFSFIFLIAHSQTHIHLILWSLPSFDTQTFADWKKCESGEKQEKFILAEKKPHRISQPYRDFIFNLQPQERNMSDDRIKPDSDKHRKKHHEILHMEKKKMRQQEQE